MPFVKATIVFKPASVGTGIKVGLRKNKGAVAAMGFYLSGEGVKALGVKDGDMCEVMVGDGEHHGLVRVQKNKAGNAKVELKGAGRTQYLAIKLGVQPAFVDRNEPTQWCQWEEIEDGWVEIVLPKWADETSPNRKPAPVTSVQPIRPAEPEPHRGPGRPPKNVTANLMGDPPPGRREMLKTIGNIKA